MSSYSPAMQQYVDIKKENSDKIIFFRLGDFYEFFFEDALICSKLLDLVLTKKKAGNGQEVDMAGIPHHAYREYAKKLVENGYKVAIVEQMENPSEVKGIVRREVVETITPATITLDQSNFDNTYLAVITLDITKYVIYYFDVVTKEVLYSDVDDVQSLILELNTLNIKEVLLNFKSKEIEKYCLDNLITLSKFNNDKITRCYDIGIEYLKSILNIDINLFNEPVLYRNENSILLSKSTLDNLEIFSTNVKNNLFNTINNTQTMMGARLLSSSLRRPFKNISLIEKRHEIIKMFNSNTLLRMEIINQLKKVFDIDRLNTRLMLKKLPPKALIKLGESIKYSLDVAKSLDNSDFDELRDLVSLIELSLINAGDSTQSRYIKQGFDENLDQIFVQANDSKAWLINYEQNLKDTLGLKSLKIGYNKVYGYYIEISKGQAKDVPDYFIRKQILVNNERFITEEMKEKEELILNSESKYIQMQSLVFDNLINKVQKYSSVISKLSNYIALIDLTSSNSQLSKQKNLISPVFSTNTNVKNSRHLTIEHIVGQTNFVSNDYDFDDKNIIILTGPNMSGKSTYMRQIAITQILAQAGLFVPASYAELQIVDQIFTRIGAGDDLSSGKSTFLVEMEETSYALKNATDDSLIILDELGRGTSTYDGLSIAYGVIKYINDNLKAKTILATHYHELTSLDELLNNCKNQTIQVEESADQVLFKHKIIDGRAQKSYGIHVAKIAQINNEVIINAEKFLEKLELNSVSEIKVDDTPKELVVSQKSNEYDKKANIGNDKIMEKLSVLDLNNTTPMQALIILNELKGLVNE